VVIICPKHGEFLQRPNDHLTGYGCKMCQYEKTSKENRFTNEEFIEKANKIHSNTYDYSLVKYDGYENKIIVICKKHGKFQQTPHSHLNGNGCRLCRESLGERKVAKFLLNNNINFEREITFKELVGDSKPLFYDFYLPDHKILIEYDGIQHNKVIPFFGGKDSLLLRKKYDFIKIKYAVNNGFKLIKIPYSVDKYFEEALFCELKNQSVL
jgi:very-short-patch-repair endonuclease